MKMCSKNKGFTLIELLVVISIISLLSSIVLTTLSNARGKAKDAAIKTGVDQLATLMNFEYDEKGNYCNLQGYGYINSTHSCNDFVGSNYATQVKEICKNIYNNAADVGWSPLGGYRIYTNTDDESPLILHRCTNEYSFMVYLNNGKWYCSGSSGIKGEYSSDSGGKGCHNNP